MYRKKLQTIHLQNKGVIMSYSTVIALPDEILYAYAITQRYNNINKKYNNNLYPKHIKVVLPKEELDKYIKTFVTYYQVKYHEDVYVFDKNIVPFNMEYKINKTKDVESIFNQMFVYDQKTNTIQTTKLFNSNFAERYCKAILTEKELNILNKTECLKISTQSTVHHTLKELQKIQYYKYCYLDLPYNFLLQKQKELKAEIKTHQMILKGLAVLTTDDSSEYNFTTADLAKTLEFLAENVSPLTKTVESLIACGKAIIHDPTPQNIITNIELTKQAKIHSNDLHSDLKKIFSSHKMDIIDNEIDNICEQLIVLSPILNSSCRTVESLNECKIQLAAINQVLPKKVLNKQIGNNTPPKKAIAKYNSMKKHQRIYNKINGKNNTRQINPADVDTYNKAKRVIKENDKSKDGR